MGYPLPFVETIFEKQGITICENYFKKQGMFERNKLCF
jgi:hypothetical protein